MKQMKHPNVVVSVRGGSQQFVAALNATGVVVASGSVRNLRPPAPLTVIEVRALPSRTGVQPLYTRPPKLPDTGCPTLA